MSSGRLQEVTNDENHKPSGPKSGHGHLPAVFTRGSNCCTLSGKILVFWIGGHLWEVIAYGVLTASS